MKPRCTTECAEDFKRLEAEKLSLLMSVSRKKSTDETAWLIELAGNHGVPNYHQLKYDDDWTPDANKALRFARREDAQAYIEHIGWTEPKPVEHMWCVPVSSYDRDGK
jgi:hypothetical protein